MRRTIARHRSTTELLEDIIRSRKRTALLICSSKDDFLHQLIPALLDSPTSPAAPAIPSSNDEDVVEPGPPSAGVPQRHSLLIPTLKQLAATKQVQLAFCPTIDTLRAYLASHVRPSADTDPTSPLVVLVNAIALHHGTSEFSVQGLSRTLALAVSSAAAIQAPHIRLVECADVHDPTNPACGPSLWDAQVPLLSGSVRLAGEGASWAGRLTSVKRIAGRWFKFERVTEEPGRTEGAEEAMQEDVLG
jgi:hypothetical protein